jgi:hypothetical protein
MIYPHADQVPPTPVFAAAEQYGPDHTPGAVPQPELEATRENITEDSALGHASYAMSRIVIESAHPARESVQAI